MKTLLFSAAIISASIFTSCNNETLISESASETNSALSLNVSELAYTPTATGSRAVTNTDAVKTTEFEEGDALGLFIISEDEAITKQNVKFTYTSGIWTPDGVVNYYANSNYIAYFPYEENLTVGSSSDIEKVIKTYFTENNFTSTDQSSKEAYQKADLMMAKLEKPKGPAISFPLKHQFSMVEISIPVRKYITTKTYDEAGTRFEYCAPHKVTWDTLTYNDNGITPYYAGNGVYRYIAVSATETPAVTISITGNVVYDKNGNIMIFDNENNKNVSLSSGSYVSYNLKNTAIPSDVTERDLEVGDYYYSDGSIYPYGDQTGLYDLDNPMVEGCIGVIYQVADHTYTQGNNEGIAVVGVNGTEWIHGNVVALNSVVGTTKWGANTLSDESNNYTSTVDSKINLALITDMRGYELSNDDYFKNQEAVADALGYQVNTPSGSSGWYLPSAGQLTTLFVELGEYNINLENTSFIGDGNSHAEKTNAYNRIRGYLEKVDGTMDSDYDGKWWTVTETGSSGTYEAYTLTFKTSGNKTGLLARRKNNGEKHYSNVRPVLSF